MKIVFRIILTILVLLAVASGTTKILLMEQDADFFGKYGFSDPILVIFGLAQLIGGLLMTFVKTRFVGATVVAITFLVSLALVLLEGNMAVSVITGVALLLLVVIMKQSWRARPE